MYNRRLPPRHPRPPRPPRPPASSRRPGQQVLHGSCPASAVPADFHPREIHGPAGVSSGNLIFHFLHYFHFLPPRLKASPVRFLDPWMFRCDAASSCNAASFCSLCSSFSLSNFVLISSSSFSSKRCFL